MKSISTRGCLVACALAGLLIAGTASAQSAPATARPSLVVKTLAGKTFNLAHERGKWVIVNFWATWCAPCIAEMPAISKFVASHKQVTAIGLAWDHSPRAKVLKFAHQHPVDYPLAQVDTQHPAGGFPVPRGLPTTYLIAPDGQVAKHFIGPVNAKLLTQAIAATKASSGSAGR